MMLQLLLQSAAILLLLTLLKPSDGAVIATRNDPNYDVVIYFNGRPLRANSMITLPAFTQTAGIIMGNGQRIPPSSQGVVNQLRIEVLRNGAAGGMVGSAGGYNQVYGNNGGYGSTTGGYYGGGGGQYGQYGTPGYGNNGGYGGYTTPYPYNRYSSTSGFFDFFNRLGK